MRSATNLPVKALPPCFSSQALFLSDDKAQHRDSPLRRPIACGGASQLAVKGSIYAASVSALWGSLSSPTPEPSFPTFRHSSLLSLDVSSGDSGMPHPHWSDRTPSKSLPLDDGGEKIEEWEAISPVPIDMRSIRKGAETRRSRGLGWSRWRRKL